MKKIIATLFLFVGMGFIVTGYADPALSCKNIVGIWRGTLNGPQGPLTNCALTIEDTGGGSHEDAAISFNTSQGDYVGYGMLVGSCKENNDGSITMDLSRKIYGIDSYLHVKLDSAEQVTVSNYSYSDTSVSYNGYDGTLNQAVQLVR